MKKLTYEETAGIVCECGYLLLTNKNEYVNTRQILTARCGQCGGITNTTLSNFRKMKGCLNCAKNKPRPYSDVKAAFQKAGCILLTPQHTYKSTEQVTYLCSCGLQSTILPYCFLIGQRCFECGKKKRQGKNHPNYKQGDKFRGSKNPNWNSSLTDAERSLRQHRGDHRYKVWRRSVYQHDNYTCKKCHKRGGQLNVHHVENFSERIDLRYDIDNGVTLCKNCHDTFHKIYGKVKNNKSQIEEFCSALL